MNSSAWLFNLGADVYAWFTAQAAWRSSCARMASRLAMDDPRRVVDLGCGPGVSTFELAWRLPRAQLIGLDVAPRMLAQARRRRPASAVRVRWLRADAAHLPFASASLDACTGHSFLYLVENRADVLREVRRVLRPGGRLVLMEPNVTAPSLGGVLDVSRDVRHLISVSLWRPFSRLHGQFSAESLAATLSRAGFEVAEVEPTLGGLGLLACARAPG